MNHLHLMTALALTFASLGSFASADDSEEVKRLKAENELLTLKLKSAEEKVASLKTDLEQAKAKLGAAVKEGGKKTLSEILEEGLIVSGDYISTKSGGKGTITLTIKERDGKKVKATAVTKYKNDPSAEHVLEGTVSDSELNLKSLGNAVNFGITVGLVKGTALQGRWASTDNQGGTVGFKLMK